MNKILEMLKEVTQNLSTHLNSQFSDAEMFSFDQSWNQLNENNVIEKSAILVNQHIQTIKTLVYRFKARSKSKGELSNGSKIKINAFESFHYQNLSWNTGKNSGKSQSFSDKYYVYIFYAYSRDNKTQKSSKNAKTKQ